MVTPEDFGGVDDGNRKTLRVKLMLVIHYQRHPDTRPTEVVTEGRSCDKSKTTVAILAQDITKATYGHSLHWNAAMGIAQDVLVQTRDAALKKRATRWADIGVRAKDEGGDR